MLLGLLVDQILGQRLQQTATVAATHCRIDRTGLGLLKLVRRQVGKFVDRVVPGLVAGQVGRVRVLDHGLVLLEDLLAKDLLGGVVGGKDVEDFLEVVLVDGVERVEVARGQMKAGGHGGEEDNEKAETAH